MAWELKPCIFTCFSLGSYGLGAQTMHFYGFCLGSYGLGAQTMHFYVFFLGILWLGSSNHAFLRVFPWDPMACKLKPCILIYFHMGSYGLQAETMHFHVCSRGILWLASWNNAFSRIFTWDPLA